MTDEIRFDPVESFAAEADPFQRLWTPHRVAYIQAGREAFDNYCPFCEGPGLSDEDSLIVYRGKLGFALLNLYPYNSGHLLICPYRHISYYDEATPEERAEIGDLTAQAMQVLRKTLNVDGFNIGINQGDVAGAGIAGHLHQHIVPRWKHDANFFPIIAQTKALPRLLGDLRVQIADAWNALTAE
ncbi:MAG: HIT domain-containing protein [Microbacteriaceae bacterium]|nr:HIT domain-containing protein [Microbacteriaceae bacterium]